VTQPTPTAPELVTNLLDALSKDVEAAVHWGWFPIPIIKHAWLKLRHLARRYAAILARFQAGTLPPPRTAAHVPPPLVGGAGGGVAPSSTLTPVGTTEPPPSPEPRPPQPSREIGWVMRTLISPRSRLDQLAAVLAHPDMPAHVAAVPQAGSVLRPLCNALMVPVPPWLRLPRRPRAPRPRRVVAIPPPPDWMLTDPDVVARPNGTYWMHLGSSRHWRPDSGITFEKARKFDPPVQIWPRPE